MIPCPICGGIVSDPDLSAHGCLVRAMDALQGVGGVVSDNCASWAEVATVDKRRALQWLAVRDGASLFDTARRADPLPCQ